MKNKSKFIFYKGGQVAPGAVQFFLRHVTLKTLPYKTDIREL